MKARKLDLKPSKAAKLYFCEGCGAVIAKGKTFVRNRSKEPICLNCAIAETKRVR